MAFKDELRDFIRENLIDEGDPDDVSDDESLIERGVIDSMGLMQVIHFIEERTGVRIADEDILPENFESLNTIEQYIATRKGKG